MGKEESKEQTLERVNHQIREREGLGGISEVQRQPCYSEGDERELAAKRL